MYICNFQQLSNNENFYDEFGLYANDDLTPIQNDQCVVQAQMWARSARGAGDQSQFYGNWPLIYNGGYTTVPSFSAATDDGTGHLVLYDGILTLNIPSTTLNRMLPGYYEIGFLILNPDKTHITQLAAGLVPIYQGLVWDVTGVWNINP